MKRIGMLTSGGDCQGLNPALRATAKVLYSEFNEDIQIHGIIDGYRGLIYGESRIMQPEDFSGIIRMGGTILGTSRQPFKYMRTNERDIDKIAAMKDNYHKLNLDSLVILGGNGTHKTANLLSQEGLNIVTLPKTIDNDIWGTDMTFGFQSAVNVATNVIDCIHSTATSHGRIFIVEVMGHKVGWLTLYAGIAGGADVILIPEIPYKMESIKAALEQRQKQGKNFSIIAVAEGAIPEKFAGLSKTELKSKMKKSKHPSISYRLAKKLTQEMGQEIRVCVPGHIQRGGDPSPFDRILSTRFGVAAAKLIKEENFGNMVALKGTKIVSVPLSDVAGKLKCVPTDSDIITTAIEMGISFGN